MITYIYILQDPKTLDVRYVGKSNNPKKRYKSHLYDNPKVKYYSYFWIQKLLKEGLKPIMTVIDETDDNWQELEMYWISQFKAWGYHLTNITSGGEGAYGAGKWNNVAVTAFTKDGILIRSFNSQKECAAYFNTSPGNVKQVVSGRNRLLLKQYQILLGTHVENVDPDTYQRPYAWANKPKTYWTCRKIKCLPENKEFISTTDAANHYNISITSISNILNGRAKKTRCGKHFIYS